MNCGEILIDNTPHLKWSGRLGIAWRVILKESPNLTSKFFCTSIFNIIYSIFFSFSCTFCSWWYFSFMLADICFTCPAFSRIWEAVVKLQKLDWPEQVSPPISPFAFQVSFLPFARRGSAMRMPGRVTFSPLPWLSHSRELWSVETWRDLLIYIVRWERYRLLFQLLLFQYIGFLLQHLGNSLVVVCEIELVKLFLILEEYDMLVLLWQVYRLILLLHPQQFLV